MYILYRKTLVEEVRCERPFSLKRPSTSRVLCRRDQDARKDDCGDRHPRACRRHDSQHHRQTVPRHGMASNAATAEPFAREESFGFTAVDLRLVLRTLLRQHANLVSERLDLALQCFDLRLLLAHSRCHLLALLSICRCIVSSHATSILSFMGVYKGSL